MRGRVCVCVCVYVCSSVCVSSHILVSAALFDLLLSSTTTDFLTPGVTTTTGSQLHTSVFDQSRRLRAHTHTHALSLTHTYTLFSFQTHLFLRNRKHGGSHFNFHACQCLRMFMYFFIYFVCLFEFVLKPVVIERRRSTLGRAEGTGGRDTWD